MCLPGTLAGYVALGTGGCTLGNSQFVDFQTLEAFDFGTPVSPSSVLISPTGSGNNTALNFMTSQVADAGMLLELQFTYTVLGTIMSEQVTLANTSVTADGIITLTQAVCAGGTFGPDGFTGCTGTAYPLAAVNSGSDSVIFLAVGVVGITNDLVFDGGTAGSASGATIVDSSAAPEPNSLWAVGVALCMFFGVSVYRAQKRINIDVYGDSDPRLKRG